MKHFQGISSFTLNTGTFIPWAWNPDGLEEKGKASEDFLHSPSYPSSPMPELQMYATISIGPGIRVYSGVWYMHKCSCTGLCGGQCPALVSNWTWIPLTLPLAMVLGLSAWPTLRFVHQALYPELLP